MGGKNHLFHLQCTKTIRNVIRKAINKNQKPDAKLHSNQLQSTKHCVFFKLQFIDRISMQIEKEIREFLCAYDIKLMMSHRSFTIGKLFPYKDRQSLLHSSGVVYQLTCSHRRSQGGGARGLPALQLK